MGFEDFPKRPQVVPNGDQSVGQPQGRPTEEELLAKRVAMAKMAGSAVESLERVMLETQLSGMASNLESVTGNDWAEFRSLVKILDMTDEEAQAAEETIVMLQSMRSEYSEERRRAALESLARRSKIIDVAIALKTFDRLPRETTQGKSDAIREGATRLMEALSYISNEQDVKESVERRGLIIPKDEMQEAIERGKQLNIV